MSKILESTHTSTHLIRAVERAARRTVRRRDRRGRRLRVPVGPDDDDGVAPEIGAAEAEVVRREGAVLLEEVAEVAGDPRVEARVEARRAAEVVAEEPEAGVELLKDDGLRLDFADLLGDDPEETI